jgi:beta-glucosidase
MYKQGRKRLRRKIISIALVIPMVVNLFAAIPVAAPAAAEGLQQESVPIYLDTSYSFEERAADLISRMTLQEKASLMISSRAAAISSLGIREYGWWNEALHGVSALQLNATGNSTIIWNTTSYPISIALGSSWDPELMYREAVMISDEAREVVPENRLNLTFYSPTINMARDPRWGRNDETFSEDPFLMTNIAAQFVNGMEGKDMEGNLLPEGNGYLKTVTTIKHYAANNSEVNRLNGTSNMDDRSLREYYTAAFRGIVQEADVHSVMTAYNEVNGVPAAANVYLLDNLLRQTFGFTGYVTSDCDSVYVISNRHQWIPPGWTSPVDQTSRTAFAVSAGGDLNCNTGYNDGQNYSNRIVPAVNANITTETGLFTENDVDTALLRLFTARMQLGEFDYDLGIDVPWITQAQERVPEGTWTNSNDNMAITETPERVAMAREVGAKTLVLLKNDETTKKDGTVGKLLPLEIPTSGPFNVAVVGYFANPNPTSSTYQYLGGYSSNQGTNARANHTNPYEGIQDAIQAINPDATVTYYRGFTGTGTSAASLTTIDDLHVAAAAAADLAIVYVGTDRGTASEDNDRTNITLPGAQASLIQQVGQANPNTIAVMETVGMMDVTTFEPYVSAMLWSCYNGQQKGAALADVLTGAYNPSGRLPFIWYESNAQIPEITDYTLRPTDTNPGRTYMYFSGPLSYPFGYGLSYSTFAYSNLQIDQKDLDANDTFQVSVDVTNTGDVQGDEVVELYVNTPDAPAELERPIKRLRGFEKVSLEPDETKTVTLSVKVPDLAFFDEALGRYVVDNGRYGVQISRSSADADIQLQDFIQVTGALDPVLEVVTVKPTQEGDEALDIPTRVLFEKHKVVIPQLTVAMSDETLYGYIKKDGSQPFPAGMTFEYSSNRPEVVSVDESGVIRTLKGGVATVTATVTYQGVSKSVDFVVYVDAKGYLDGINVDGKPLDGFVKDRFTYSVAVPYGVDTVPMVSPVSDDPDVNIVSVTQASSIPGVATIETQEGNFTQTYQIGFGRPPLSADFTTGELGEEWSILNEDSGNYSFVADGLQITTQEGDLTDGSAKNVFVQPAFGDWLAETHILLSAAPNANYQQAGLVVYENNNNYLKLVYDTSSFGPFVFRRFSFYKTSDGSTSQIGSAFSFPQYTDLYFRIGKVGSNYEAYYSTDGDDFSLLGAASAQYLNPQIGLLAINGTPSTAGPINAVFAYLDVDRVVLSPIGDQSVDENRTLAFTVEASDSWGHPLTYSSGELPPGASFDVETQEFTWTPDYTQAGTYPVHFEVTDGYLIAGEDIVITVNDVLVIDQVDSLKAYIADLPIVGGLKNALTVKLDQVLKLLDKDKVTEAVSILEDDFIGQVYSLRDEGKLTEEQAAELVKSAEEIVLNILSSQ